MWELMGWVAVAVREEAEKVVVGWVEQLEEPPTKGSGMREVAAPNSLCCGSHEGAGVGVLYSGSVVFLLLSFG